jgi:hypothetical protein
LPGHREEILAPDRKAYLPRRPVEQAGADVLFELVDRDRQCGLRQQQAIRCAREVPFPGHGDKRPQMPQIYRCSHAPASPSPLMNVTK